MSICVYRSNSLGQSLAWQLFVSRPSPLQSLPPRWGIGELQCRMRVINPSPHVTEHEDQGDHRLQPPSWRTKHTGTQCFLHLPHFFHLPQREFWLAQRKCFPYLCGHIFLSCTSESGWRGQRMCCWCRHMICLFVAFRCHRWQYTESTLTMETSHPHCPLLDPKIGAN